MCQPREKSRRERRQRTHARAPITRHPGTSAATNQPTLVSETFATRVRSYAQSELLKRCEGTSRSATPLSSPDRRIKGLAPVEAGTCSGACTYKPIPSSQSRSGCAARTARHASRLRTSAADLCCSHCSLCSQTHGVVIMEALTRTVPAAGKPRLCRAHPCRVRSTRAACTYRRWSSRCVWFRETPSPNNKKQADKRVVTQRRFPSPESSHKSGPSRSQQWRPSLNQRLRTACNAQRRNA